jgi:hypothetical protein
LPLAGLEDFDCGLTGIGKSQGSFNAKAQRRKEREEGKIMDGKIIGSGADLSADAIGESVFFDMKTDFRFGRERWRLK